VSHVAVRAGALAAIAVADVVAVVVAQPLYPPGAFDLSAGLIFTAAVTTFAGVGAFLTVRVPGNSIGPLLLVAATMLGFGVFAGAYGQASLYRADGAWPATAVMAWLNNVLFVAPVVIVAAAVPSVYPDGRLPSPRWRWLPVLMVVGTVLATLQPAFRPGSIGDPFALDNPFALPALAPLLEMAGVIATVTAAPVFLGAVAAVATRFRRGTPVERQQVKWLLSVAAVAAVALSLAFVAAAVAPGSPFADLGLIVGFAALAAMPVAIGLAIARHRLYEIDRIISRTVGWTLVTGILVAVFAGLVVGFQALLAGFTQGQTLAVAASTLVAFALFQPLRHRVQRVVDRRFDRARYSGEQVALHFGGRMRDETDLGRASSALRDTAHAAVRPVFASVWLREGRP
jgi:hypothetical protein